MLHDLCPYLCLLSRLAVYSMTFAWISDGRESFKQSNSFIGMHLNNIHYHSHNMFDVIQDDFSGY
jgi:hypothetical protein